MSKPQTHTGTSDPDRLAREAKAMGMSVETYQKFLEWRGQTTTDPRFASALKHVFTKFPKTLKKLAE